MELTDKNVEEIFTDCLGNECDLLVEGVLLATYFKQDRIDKYKNDIMDMLLCLPDGFLKSKGGGYTFLNACLDNNGRQWTEGHQMIDKLICLGLAIGKVKFCLCRDLWRFLPMGMPYFTVIDTEFTEGHK